MKVGDMVRFAMWNEIVDVNGDWANVLKSHIGLLIDYDKLMKTATVLYKNEVLDTRAQLVEKAGKRDFENIKGL